MTTSVSTNTGVKQKLRSYLVLSDIHLGARTTTAEEIIEHLTAFFDDFTEKSPYARVDALFIAGDLWDDTLTFSSDVFLIFLPWFRRLLSFCSRHGVKLRIMEGTPRHDRKQAATLAKIVEMTDIALDFKYIADLSIEKMTDLDLTILYVPDECRHTAAAVEEDVERTMDEAGVREVDIAIMHGMFEYQLGTVPMNAKVHNEAWYLARVKNYISIGHVHTMSQCGRILAEGSFDRLAHGEEGPKGAMLIQETSSGEWMHLFVENPLAKTYLTIPVSGSIESALDKIEKKVRKLRDGSYVRIQALATHAIFQGFETLRQKYPRFTFSKKATVKEEVRQEVQTISYSPIVLNRETLTDAICEEVANQGNLETEDYHKLRSLLEGLHD